MHGSFTGSLYRATLFPMQTDIFTKMLLVLTIFQIIQLHNLFHYSAENMIDRHFCENIK